MGAGEQGLLLLKTSWLWYRRTLSLHYCSWHHCLETVVAEAALDQLGFLYYSLRTPNAYTNDLGWHSVNPCYDGIKESQGNVFFRSCPSSPLKSEARAEVSKHASAIWTF